MDSLFGLKRPLDRSQDPDLIVWSLRNSLFIAGAWMTFIEVHVGVPFWYIKPRFTQFYQFRTMAIVNPFSR